MLTILTAASATVAMPIGTFTKKIHRQPRVSVRRPPTSGPMATAAPDRRPPRRDRASAVVAVVGLPDQRQAGGEHRAAAQTLECARPDQDVRRLRHPAANDATVNTTRPTMNTRFRPNLSASAPQVRITLASDSA